MVYLASELASLFFLNFYFQHQVIMSTFNFGKEYFITSWKIFTSSLPVTDKQLNKIILNKEKIHLVWFNATGVQESN